MNNKQTEGGGPNPLSEKEIRLFKYLNKYKTEYPTQQKLLGFIRTMMPFINRPESDARFYYEIYTANYRPDGDYENLDKLSFRDFKSFKQRRIPNNTAYEYTASKIPFKGSNLQGYWDVNSRNDWFYVVESYEWYPIYLFINNEWFEVSNRYSSTTRKQMSQSNPVRYNSGLRSKVNIVTSDELRNIMRGKSFDEIKSDRVNKFTTEKRPKEIVGVPKWLTIGWGDNRKKVNYTVTKIGKQGGKIKIMITINKAGTTEGNNKLVVNPDGYEVPSEFSKEIENGIEAKIINDNREFLTDENTTFIFKHIQ